MGEREPDHICITAFPLRVKVALAEHNLEMEMINKTKYWQNMNLQWILETSEVGLIVSLSSTNHLPKEGTAGRSTIPVATAFLLQQARVGHVSCPDPMNVSGSGDLLLLLTDYLHITLTLSLAENSRGAGTGTSLHYTLLSSVGDYYVMATAQIIRELLNHLDDRVISISYRVA